MILATFCVAVFAAGCGKPVETPGSVGGSTPTPAGGVPLVGPTVEVTFTEWSISVSPATAAKGSVQLKVKNGGKTPHGLYISGPGVDGKGNLLQPGASESQTRSLDTGEYQIIDFVGANETEHNMTATLVVK